MKTGTMYVELATVVRAPGTVADSLCKLLLVKGMDYEVGANILIAYVDNYNMWGSLQHTQMKGLTNFFLLENVTFGLTT